MSFAVDTTQFSQLKQYYWDFEGIPQLRIAPTVSATVKDLELGLTLAQVSKGGIIPKLRHFTFNRKLNANSRTYIKAGQEAFSAYTSSLSGPWTMDGELLNQAENNLETILRLDPSPLVNGIAGIVGKGILAVDSPQVFVVAPKHSPLWVVASPGINNGNPIPRLALAANDLDLENVTRAKLDFNGMYMLTQILTQRAHNIIAGTKQMRLGGNGLAYTPLDTVFQSLFGERAFNTRRVVAGVES